MLPKLQGHLTIASLVELSGVVPMLSVLPFDFSLPKGLGTYWQWSGCKEGKACTYPQALRQDAILKRMVAVFEKHGFIWGGKWYHYDSVHFEYRPELLIKQCRSL